MVPSRCTMMWTHELCQLKEGVNGNQNPSVSEWQGHFSIFHPVFLKKLYNSMHYRRKFRSLTSDNMDS